MKAAPVAVQLVLAWIRVRKQQEAYGSNRARAGGSVKYAPLCSRLSRLHGRVYDYSGSRQAHGKQTVERRLAIGAARCAFAALRRHRAVATFSSVTELCSRV